MLIDRIRGWLERTAAGWPDDNVCDLERYLPRDKRMVLYDSEMLKDLRGACVWVANKTKPVITVTTQRRLRQRRPRSRVPAREDRKLCWIGDLGDVHRPIRDWADLRAALSEHGGEVERLIRLGVVRFLLLEYRRGGKLSRPCPRRTTAARLRRADCGRRRGRGHQQNEPDPTGRHR